MTSIVSKNRKLNQKSASAIAMEKLLPQDKLPGPNQIIYKNMMKKSGGIFKSIKNRMFVLTKDWLGYYDMSSGTKLKGSIPLTEIMKISSHTIKPNIFYVHLKNRKFEFIGNDQDNKDKWINMINGSRWNLYNSMEEAKMNYNSESSKTFLYMHIQG